MPLTDLLTFFRPLAAQRERSGDFDILLTPQTNVLALNCAYGPEESGAAREGLLGTFAAWGAPPLVLSPYLWAGEDVGGLRVGKWAAQPEDTGIRVEQISRLHLTQWAAVLAESYDTPEWAAPLARHFATALEGQRDYVLLLAYAGDEALGAGLWQARSAGGAMHLWGVLEGAVERPLLNTAADLSGGQVRVSLPDHSALRMEDETVLTFTLLH